MVSPELNVDGQARYMGQVGGWVTGKSSAITRSVAQLEIHGDPALIHSCFPPHWLCRSEMQQQRSTQHGWKGRPHPHTLLRSFTRLMPRVGASCLAAASWLRPHARVTSSAAALVLAQLNLKYKLLLRQAAIIFSPRCGCWQPF